MLLWQCVVLLCTINMCYNNEFTHQYAHLTCVIMACEMGWTYGVRRHILVDNLFYCWKLFYLQYNIPWDDSGKFKSHKGHCFRYRQSQGAVAHRFCMHSSCTFMSPWSNMSRNPFILTTQVFALQVLALLPPRPEKSTTPVKY